MFTNKLHAGSSFPEIKAKMLSGEELVLSKPEGDKDWKMVVVYRGRHCPLCTKYLNELEQYVQALGEVGVDIVAVSGDSKEQLESHLEKLNVTFPLAYGLRFLKK